MTEFLKHDAIVSTDPFRHTRLPLAVPKGVADDALSWLETEAPWHLRTEDFYVQHEFSLLSTPLGSAISPLASKPFIDEIASWLDESFSIGRQLKLVDVNAHRLTSGQVIRLHNDYIGSAETHRLLIQLNSGWKVSQGGLLMLFANDDVQSVRDIIVPNHGSGFAFEISPKSFHAVSGIKEGSRYTVVYTFA